jgi:hypothetical protein
VFDPRSTETKRADLSVDPFFVLVELRGIETLTPRLPEGKGRKTQSTILELSPDFPFLPVIHGVFGFAMIAPVTMIMPVWIRFSTNLGQW